MGEGIIAVIAKRLVENGGAALIIDYGYAQSDEGETLQALLRHAYADPLSTLGESDLTAHVDFAALSTAARRAGAAVFGPIPQGIFLQRLGVEIRGAQLLDTANKKMAFLIQSGIKRLIDPQEMGTLFKAMAMTAPGGAHPPVFEGEVKP